MTRRIPPSRSRPATSILSWPRAFSKGNSDPEERLKLMDMDGVDSELIQATNMLLAMRIRETAVLNDCAAVFNDFCVEYCRIRPQTPGRFGDDPDA